MSPGTEARGPERDSRGRGGGPTLLSALLWGQGDSGAPTAVASTGPAKRTRDGGSATEGQGLETRRRAEGYCAGESQSKHTARTGRLWVGTEETAMGQNDGTFC